MESDDAILAFAALAQSTRLAVFRLLIEHEPDGLPAGDVARQVDVQTAVAGVATQVKRWSINASKLSPEPSSTAALPVNRCQRSTATST